MQHYYKFLFYHNQTDLQSYKSVETLETFQLILKKVPGHEIETRPFHIELRVTTTSRNNSLRQPFDISICSAL